MDTTLSLKLPPKNYRRIIEELSVVIPDPVLKLKFLQQAINEHQKISAPYKLCPPIAGIAFRKKILENAEKISPGSKKTARNLIRKRVISPPYIKLWWLYKLRYVIGSAILMLFIWGVATTVSPLVRSFNIGARINLNSQQAKTTNTKIIIRKPIFYSQLPKSGDSSNSSIVKHVNHQNGPELVLKYLQNPILVALRPLRKPEYHLGSYLPKAVFILSAALKAKNTHLHLSSCLQNIKMNLDRFLKFLQNPILAALTASPQNQDVTSDRIPQKPFLSSRPPEGENNTSHPIVKPAKYQNESGQDLKFLQNPILAALMAPSQNQNATSNRIPQRTFLSTRPPEVKKRSSLPAVKIVNYQLETEQVPEFLQTPIWLVEKTSDREIYSNRLQIITTHTISNLPREYYRFPKNSDHLPATSIITDKISGHCVSCIGKRPVPLHAGDESLHPEIQQTTDQISHASKVLSFFH